MTTLKKAQLLADLRALDDRRVDRAFALLYREYFPVIRSFVQNNSGSEEDAADLFQDALIVFYHKVRDKKFELSCTIKTFIFSICKRQWLKKLNRKKQQLLKNETFETVSLEPNIEDILEDSEQSKLVSRLLKQIGEDGERILTYFFFDGMKTEEVTQKMGFANEQVTRNKKSRCLKKLRDLLKESAIIKDLLP